jgi:hypothetical protein
MFQSIGCATILPVRALGSQSLVLGGGPGRKGLLRYRASEIEKFIAELERLSSSWQASVRLAIGAPAHVSSDRGVGNMSAIITKGDGLHGRGAPGSPSQLWLCQFVPADKSNVEFPATTRKV